MVTSKHPRSTQRALVKCHNKWSTLSKHSSHTFPTHRSATTFSDPAASKSPANEFSTKVVYLSTRRLLWYCRAIDALERGNASSSSSTECQPHAKWSCCFRIRFGTKHAHKSPNLISRFGLQSRIAGEDELLSTPKSNATTSSQGSPSAWAQTPEERAKLLKDRKEQMILEARKKLLERQQKTTQEAPAPDASA